MDFATARAALPSMTRNRFGEKISILPFKQGEMTSIADVTRLVMMDVRARFDLAPDEERLGGGNRQGSVARVAATHPTVTVLATDLSWQPVKGDRVMLANGEIYEIVRAGRDGNSIMILYLSRV